MSYKLIQKPLAAAIGAVFITSLSGAPIANASENPFSATQLSSGYMVADKAEGKCGEGKCGGKSKDMKKEMGEGKCGGMSKAKGEGMYGMKMMDANGDGKITKEEFVSSHEKMFSMKDKNNDGVLDASEMKMMKESKYGSKPMKKGKEGKCGAMDKDKDMKKGMGEDKCGGKK